jgi:Kef-type K+ transport system membrane component KefB
MRPLDARPPGGILASDGEASVLSTAVILTTLGALMLGGLAVEWAGRHLPLPRVTLLIGFGVLVGPQALDLLPSGAADQWFETVTTLALVMVGFLVGERFSLDRLRARGRFILGISLVEALATGAVATIGLLVVGASLPLALLLGSIACATAPASTYDVIEEERAAGTFTDTVLGIIGVDDAWALLVFSVAAAAVAAMTGDGTGAGFLAHAAREIGGAILLGSVLGLAAGLLTQRIAPGEPTLLEAAAIVLLTSGLASLFGASFILVAIVLGAVMTNVARHHDSAFHEIEHLEWPFMLLFFVLAGASLHLEALAAIGLFGAAYILLRIAGKFFGAALGARLTGAESPIRRWTGLALMPQAGVALGMALLADQRFPEIGEILLPLVIGSTVVFELLGPLGTRFALRAAGEAGRRGPPGR